MTVEIKKESVWKGEWRSGGMGDIEGGGERKREEEKESVCGRKQELGGEWVE